MIRLFLACLVVGASNLAFAAFEPPYCSGIVRTTFSPANPGASDLIAIWNAANWTPSWWTPATGFIVSLTTVDLDQSRVALDVIFTDDASKFPSYRLVDSYGDSPFALVGPLAPGNYQVNASVRAADPVTGSIAPVCPNAPTQTATLVVSTQPAPTQTAPIIEFYNAVLDHYFMSQDAKEISDLDNGVHPGWTRTGYSILAYTLRGSDNRGRQVARYYAPPTTHIDSHFYTASNREVSGMQAAGMFAVWGFEGTVFEIPTPDTRTGACMPNQMPVYRLWNGRSDSNHRYTTDLAVRDQLIATGWTPEGYGPSAVVMCAPNPLVPQ
jgi:hypothetical protein